MSDYTKGPWELVKEPDDGEREWGLKGEDEYWIATLHMHTCTPMEANRNLIAAAPELLEACKEFVRKCECGEARSVRSYKQMKEAIAKAEGNTYGQQ